MPGLVLFLSTGRCGTQWLASSLKQAYGDETIVTHEPIGWQYRPNLFLRSYDRLDDMLLIDRVRNHLDAVERIIETKTYIETGWPSYAAIPLFKRRFGDQLKLIHLLRHPVPTALSYVTLGLFDGRTDEWARYCFLDPSCPGVLHKDYADRWPELTPYQKVLFGWTEIHSYGREIQALFPKMPYHTIKSEDLFAGDDTLEELTAFMGLPFRESLRDSSSIHVDSFRFRSPRASDWRRIFDLPETVTLAQSLGYDLAAVENETFNERYRGPIPGWRLRSWRMLALARFNELNRRLGRVAARLIRRVRN
jgi:hypothetical protein